MRDRCDLPDGEPANLAEGRARRGRDRLHHFRIAYGSALEAASHLELLAAASAVGGERVRDVLPTLTGPAA